MDAVVSLRTVSELRDFVHRTLCLQDHLDPVQTPLLEAVIRKQGRPCGLFWQIQGPRLLRTHAIWAADEDRILFYDSTGTRCREARLSDSPDLPSAA